MTVDRYIGELLYDYECVILPGLGGLISNKKPAIVNKITHQFNPPYYQLFFNVHLTENDGLLINYIARREAIGFAEAKARVEEYVRECRASLASGSTVTLHDLGTLSQDSSGNIYFRQDMAVNYDPESFGLVSFVSPLIKRQTEEEKIKAIYAAVKKEKPAARDRKPVRVISRKGIGRMIARAAVLILLISSISWGLINRDEVNGYFTEYAAINPFAKKSPHYQPRTVKDPFAMVEKSKAAAKEENIPASDPMENKVSEEEVAAEVPVDVHSGNATEVVSTGPEKTTEPVEPGMEASENPGMEDATPAAIRRYLIIAGSFESHLNAESLVRDLRTRGYDAHIADTNKYGMYRVAYEGAESFNLAKQRLMAIRNEDNSEAWILKK